MTLCFSENLCDQICIGLQAIGEGGGLEVSLCFPFAFKSAFLD